MKLEVGNFVLIRHACYGYSPNLVADLGPWIVQVKEVAGDGFNFDHFTRIDGFRTTKASGFAPYSALICHVHEKDVETLFKKPKL